MKETIIAVLIVAGVVGPLLYLIGQGSKSIQQEALECEVRGGVHVRKYNGFACVEPRR